MHGHIYMILLENTNICILHYYEIVSMDKCINSFIKFYGCEKRNKGAIIL